MAAVTFVCLPPADANILCAEDDDGQRAARGGGGGCWLRHVAAPAALYPPTTLAPGP